jgi:hypothetical protein
LKNTIFGILDTLPHGRNNSSCKFYNLLIFIEKDFSGGLKRTGKPRYDARTMFRRRKMTDKNSNAQQAARAVGRLKNKSGKEERLQGWRDACAEQGLSGEFVLSAKLNGASYTEEEAAMVAELFGR